MENTRTDSERKHLARSGRVGSKYVVVCDDCGPVGWPQDFKADAEAIAARHTEIGGFG